MSGQFDLFGAPMEVQKAGHAMPLRARADDAAPLPDQPARDRIQQDLDTNLLVEAGAGAGKTTEMVRRMVALVWSGRAAVSEIAAVTFTRKAASELRERFQTALEKALRDTTAAGDEDAAARLDQALREIDRAFLGTIHAFCARLLRERPLEAGLDPGFRETLGAEEKRLRREFWLTHLERLVSTGDASLAALAEVGLASDRLYPLFEDLVEQPDVMFPAEEAERPRAAPLRRRLEELMDHAVSLMPAEEPAKGWDPLQNTLRKLRFHRFVLSWQSQTRFLEVIGELTPGSFKVTKNRWPDGAAAKAVGEELKRLFEPGGEADRVLREWWEYRYPIVLSFARKAAQAYERERLRTGTLNFQDLLMFAAGLLRESPPARRELGERYRFVLVDEFQDTDPVQAEVLFLLASEPAGRDVVGPHSWWNVTPRPGALFVVGDPKQSIYRFRRADMTLYKQVKKRFQAWGAAVELTANFRSRKAIERMVNENFVDRFPQEASDVQARFAPMVVRPREDGDEGGVFWYELGNPVMKVGALVEEDSHCLATWIAQRIESGERAPGDFLVLTPKTRYLADYAAALERRNVPVQVTGAGVSEDKELRELRLLLRALADPGDPTLTVAAMVGLFFGLDYEQLAQHRLDRGGHFSFTGAPDEPRTEVEAALATLRRWWRWTRDEPADVAVARIVGELGLLPYAAAGGLGASRAGALLFALDAIRAASLAGDASLAGALAALDSALDEDESEAPLEPGRTDVVRVMNLHKAKGLEARVVVLAMPFGDYSPDPTRRVVRDDTGTALGYTVLGENRGFNKFVPLAQPPGWAEHVQKEKDFALAEDDRLLYVAATRAAVELVVGCLDKSASPSVWRSFHPWLRENATPLVLPEPVWVERRKLERSAEDLLRDVAAADARRAEAARPSYRAAAVTTRKIEVQPPAGTPTVASATAPSDGLRADRRERGTDWGSAVHGALEHAARGESGDRLRSLCRTLLIGHERPIGPGGDPEELDELLATVGSVMESEVWRRAERSPVRLIEAPFALRLTREEYAAILGAEPEPDAPAVEIVDGRIDLAFRDDGGWTIVDYKSDALGRDVPGEQMARYQAQVRLYAEAWSRLTGEPVVEKLLLFTAGGQPVPVP